MVSHADRDACACISPQGDFTALHLAARGCHTEAAELLLELGADVNCEGFDENEVRDADDLLQPKHTCYNGFACWGKTHSAVGHHCSTPRAQGTCVW